MPTVTNNLQQVITYNKSSLGFLLNSFAFLKTTNKEYLNFNEDISYNLGATVSFDSPPRYTSTPSLEVTFQGSEQRRTTLTVDHPISVALQFSDQDFIFNAKQYMQKFGAAAIKKIGNDIELDVAKVAETNTFRFYGDGITPITTSLQVITALEQFRNFGAVYTDTRCYLSNTTYPRIINSTANQFVQNRNERQYMSWELGEMDGCEFYKSNLLPVHTAGTEGNAGTTLTVVSTVVNADGAVTSITFSGTAAAADPNSVKAFDKFMFSDGVAGQPDLRFLTWMGYNPSECPVQFRAIANAASTGGNQVTVSIYPPLQAPAGKNQNLNTTIVPGMQVTALPNHRCGLITSGNPLYLAMPKLPSTSPFEGSVVQDSDSGASLRMYHGFQFGLGSQGFVYDAIWGKTLVDEYAMMVALPVS